MSELSFLAQMERDKLIEDIRAVVRREIRTAFAPVCWVSAKEYRKQYGISQPSLFRKLSKLKYHKAVTGTGKGARFDRFFNPFTLKRE